ncbi:MAG: flagellar brake protein [Bacillota bacterium]
MVGFDFADSREIKNLDLRTKLITNDIVKLGVVTGTEQDCLAKITNVQAEVFRFELLEECNILLEIGQECEIIFMKETGVYKIVVQLKDLISRGAKQILEVKAVGGAYKIQNRSYFRLNIYKRVSFTKITRLDAENSSQESKGVMENISAAGAKLITNTALKSNNYLNLDFSFAELSFSTIIAKVIRVKKNFTNSKSPEYYEVGLEFIWEDLSYQDELANWLNRQTYKYL